MSTKKQASVERVFVLWQPGEKGKLRMFGLYRSAKQPNDIINSKPVKERRNWYLEEWEVQD